MSHEPLFMCIWIVILAFAFWSISFALTHLLPNKDGSPDTTAIYIMAIYGTCLVMLVMGGFFYFFTTWRLGNNIFKSG